MPDNALRINKMKCTLLTAEKLRTLRKIILLDKMFIDVHIYNKLNFRHNFLKTKRYLKNIISNMNYEIDTLKLRLNRHPALMQYI